MAYHFISVLGTSLYEPVRYSFDGAAGEVQEYIQLALIDAYKEELKTPDAQISVIMTDKARKSNWDNRRLTERDCETMSKWRGEQAERSFGEEKSGLEVQFKQQFPELISHRQEVSIDDPGDADSIWKLFNKIYDTLRPGDEIIFDITHSFRSIPMLAISVINYAKILKNCSLKGIYYGAYEAAKEEPELGKVAPIVDLTLYNDILEWTNAANVFMKLGNASLIKETFDQTYGNLAAGPGESARSYQKALKPLRNMVDAAVCLSDTIQTSRGAGAAGLSNKNARERKRSSIQAAVSNYLEKCEQQPEGEVKELTPAYKLLEKTREAYAGLNKEENYRTGIQVTHWCIDHGMTQQGYTALEESVITYVCHKYGVNDTELEMREDVVSWAISGMGKALENKQEDSISFKLETPEDRKAYFESDQKKYLSEKLSPEYKELAEDIFVTIDMDIVKLVKGIKYYRNDINHFGMRKNPKTPDDLREKLKEYLGKFEELEGREGR